MFVSGHLAASYIVSRLPALVGYRVTPYETLLILGSGIILDTDLLYAFITRSSGEAHHGYLTHTPLGVVGVWLITIAVFGKDVSFLAQILMLIALLVHLACDDLSYWVSQLKFEKSSPYPQINWFYPLRQFHAQYDKITPPLTAQLNYFKNARVTFFIELTLITIAVMLYLN